VLPDVARAIAKLSPRPLILDGEVAVFDEQLPIVVIIPLSRVIALDQGPIP